MAVAIGNLGTIPTLTVGNRVFTDLTNLITLSGFVSGGGNYGTMRAPNGTAGYQVTAGKTYTIHSLIITGGGVTGTGAGTILYGNTDVGTGAGSAPTTPIYYGGYGAGGLLTASNFPPSITGTFCNPMFQIPATKYPAVINSSTAFYLSYGYET